MQKRLVSLIAVGLLFCASSAVMAGPKEDFATCDAAKDTTSTISACNKVLDNPKQSDANRAIAYGNRGWAYSELGDERKSIEDSNSSIKIDDTNAYVYNNRGYSHFRLGEFDLALADYAESIKRDPAFVLPLNNRGEIYYNRGQFEKAIADYSKVIEIDPKNVDGWNNRGACYQSTKQYDKAITDLTQAIKLNPKYVLAQANRIEVYFTVGLIDKATNEADALVKKFPKDGDAYNIRGWVRTQLKNLDDALADHDKAIELRPKDANFRGRRGAALIEKGRFADAIKDLDTASSLSPEESEYVRLRAEAKLGLGDVEGATADAQKAVAMEPTDEDVKQTLSKVRSLVLAAPKEPDVSATVLEPITKAVDPNATSLPSTPKTKIANPSATGKRVALIIGNSAYGDGMALSNPVNDANGMAAALKRLGFDVVLATNANKVAMDDAMYQFAVKAEGADAALVFYAGHGMQVDGVNYLMPIDGSVESKADLKHKFVAADDILDDLKSVKGMRMLILDACRNNPLSRSIKLKLSKVANRAIDDRAGLADMKAEGVLIAFATQPNEVAADGDAADSPFTLALLKHIETPNVEIDTIFKRVRTTVSEMTDGVQLPQTVNSSTGEFYLKQE